MGSAVSWSRSPAQEPGAAVRQPRPAWWTDHPSAGAGSGGGEVGGGMRPGKVAVTQPSVRAPVAPRPSRASFAPNTGYEVTGQTGASPDALLLLHAPNLAADAR